MGRRADGPLPRPPRRHRRLRRHDPARPGGQGRDRGRQPVLQLLAHQGGAPGDRGQAAEAGPRSAVLLRRPDLPSHRAHGRMARVRPAVSRGHQGSPDGLHSRRPRRRAPESLGRGGRTFHAQRRRRRRLLLPRGLREHGAARAVVAPARPGRSGAGPAGHLRLLHAAAARRRRLRHPRGSQVQDRPAGHDSRDGPAARPHQRRVATTRRPSTCRASSCSATAR